MPVHLAQVSDYLLNVTISRSNIMICSERAFHCEASSMLTGEFLTLYRRAIAQKQASLQLQRRESEAMSRRRKKHSPFEMITTFSTVTATKGKGIM